MLSETDANGTTQRWFVYGNYIDEPLMMYANCIEKIEEPLHLFKRKYYYVQDAIYNVRALVSDEGWVIEEQTAYNVYGEALSWVSGDFDADGSVGVADFQALQDSWFEDECDPNYNWRCDFDNSSKVSITDFYAQQRNWYKSPADNQHSLFTNPYLFTGRRVDILDDGSLKIQYNRNRYYDQHTGRWLAHDPLGITPNPQLPNYFDIISQYKDGLSLYEALMSQPISNLDPFGLACSMTPKYDLRNYYWWVAIKNSLNCPSFPPGNSNEAVNYLCTRPCAGGFQRFCHVRYSNNAGTDMEWGQWDVTVWTWCAMCIGCCPPSHITGECGTCRKATITKYYTVIETIIDHRDYCQCCYD